jgi:DnaJ-class molecular chaperone
VKRNASEKEIKSAFRKMARKLHPDLNPNDKEAEARFKEANEAYEVLSDPDKRKKYDQFGADWERYQQAEGAPGGFDFSKYAQSYPGGGVRFTTTDFSDLGDSGFSDFFEMLFGRSAAGMGGNARAGASNSPYYTGGRNRTAPRQGEDYQHDIDVTLEEAFTGTQRVLQMEAPEACPTCNGRGIVNNRVCTTCNGEGTVSRTRRIEVKIPPGVHTGSRVRVAGEGGLGSGGGGKGDLYLRVAVLPNKRFERKGDDLYTTVSVPLYTVVLGGEIEVPTIKGTKLALKIPAATQNGRTFRLAGQGMPNLKDPNKRGDLMARLEVQLPTELTDEEKQHFAELQRIYDRRRGS